MSVSNGYAYFFFEPLKFDLFYERLQPEYNFASVEDAQRIYFEWMVEYLARADRFYQAQYDLHQDYVAHDFREIHGLPEESSPLEYGLGEAWGDARQVTGLEAHYQEFRDARGRSIDLTRYLNQRLGSDDGIKRVAEIMRNPIPLRAANALWFNTTINNPQTVVVELSRLSSDQYRQSEHWARVRAAMLLIHRAMCQAQPHFMVGESWYGGGWETDLHVQHLNYDHLGNERYEDLVLLCDEHYNLWHENTDETGEPGFEIADDNFL